MANGVHAAKRFYDFRHVRQNIGELATALDRLAACIVNDVVSVLTPELRSRRHHHGFGNDQAMRQIEILSHAPLVNDEPREHEFCVSQ